MQLNMRGKISIHPRKKLMCRWTCMSCIAALQCRWQPRFAAGLAAALRAVPAQDPIGAATIDKGTDSKRIANPIGVPDPSCTDGRAEGELT
jgi:hypothetical protein